MARPVSAPLLLLSFVAACESFGADGPSPASSVDAGGDAPAVVAQDAASRDGALPDAEDDAGDAGDGICHGVADCARYVFVTSAEEYSGNDIGGSVSGDGRCTVKAQTSASPFLRKRKFKAWMSDGNIAFAAAARLTHGTKPYRLVDGTVIANDWTQLTTGSLFHAIDMDENGTHVASGFVWTGTNIFGQPTDKTCTSWTITGAEDVGTVGRLEATDSTWTNSGAMDCGAGKRLYCFEE